MDVALSSAISNVYFPNERDCQCKVLLEGKEIVDATLRDEITENRKFDAFHLKQSGTPRLRLNSYQKRILEQVFVLSPYLDYLEQGQMAEMLGIPKKALQNWFRNKRYRSKKRKEEHAAELFPPNERRNYCKVEQWNP